MVRQITSAGLRGLSRWLPYSVPPVETGLLVLFTILALVGG